MRLLNVYLSLSQKAVEHILLLELKTVFLTWKIKNITITFIIYNVYHLNLALTSIDDKQNA